MVVGTPVDVQGMVSRTLRGLPCDVAVDAGSLGVSTVGWRGARARGGVQALVSHFI